MLKPIAQPFCTPALHACRRMQVRLLEWLSDTAVASASITRPNIGNVVATTIEADWLWQFLQREADGRLLLERTVTLADMSLDDKNLLRLWIQVVSSIENQFQPGPASWPNHQTDPAISSVAWRALKELMEAFYEKGLKSANGLPYDALGQPTAGMGVTYQLFMNEFRDAHRLNPNPDAREVCVLCGGPLGQTPEADHWVSKGKFPLLSVCGKNLLPTCGDCNSTSNKGEKPVYTNGSTTAFHDWFHPYFRHSNGAIAISYDLAKREIQVTANAPTDATRVANIDRLLNLSERWTREFKAEYVAEQTAIYKRIENGSLNLSQADIQRHIQNEQLALVPSEPNHEINVNVYSALLDTARLAAWEVELGLQ